MLPGVPSFPNACRPRSLGWISRAWGYPLPAGLLNRTPVRVLAMGEVAVVETEDYRKWIVSGHPIDCGWRFDVRGNGSKTPESHPAVLDRLERQLMALRSERPRPGCEAVERDTLKQIDDIKWLLRRNGREVAPETNPRRRDLEESYEREAFDGQDPAAVCHAFGWEPQRPPDTHEEHPL